MPRSSATRRWKRRPWIRSTACCSSSPTRRSSTRVTTPARYPGRIGVFAASALNTYLLNAALNRRLAEDYIPTLIGNDKDFLATRISYKLNLKGPSLTVQTACSSSLVAIHLACQSLLCEESDMALAGAVSVRVPHRAGYFCDAGGVVSPDGRVRAFDAKANGTVFGSGGGVLVLKRLADALADGDSIHARDPGLGGQQRRRRESGLHRAERRQPRPTRWCEALANAGVEADSVSYLEAHGSGTPVGDPIEVRALTKAFRAFTRRSGYCALGSVKTNVGHLDAAAGIAGVIKTVLALRHRQIPPSLHFTEPNPEIDFAATPFYVNTELRPWASDGPRRAGVMATGMGGTNAHLVLEEAPPQPRAATGPGPHLLLLSAKTAGTLDSATGRLEGFLTNKDVDLGDVAHTLRVGRKAYAHRRYLLNGKAHSGKAGEPRRPLALLLPGIGDQYAGMGRELYETQEVFRQELDRCATILEPHLGLDIRSVLYPAVEKNTAGKGIDLKKMLARADPGKLGQTLFAQPALFAVEYAMSRLWHSLGVTPDVIVGHSMGEYVAACLAGVMSLEDALRLIATRARLVEALPRSAMLAVAASERALLTLLPAEVSIALINGPELCVVAGPGEAIAAFQNILLEKKMIARPVANAHAFHSCALEPIAPAFEREVAQVRLAEPKIRYVSNVTGTWITPGEATSPAYWARHATRSARFSDALAELWRLGNPVLLEAGPGRTLSVLAAQHPARAESAGVSAVHSLRHDYENESDVEVLLHAVGKLWVCGIDTHWQPAAARRIALPTYPFERQHYWLDQEKSSPQREGLDNWFYVPTWERTPLPRGPAPAEVLWLGADDDYLKLLAQREHAINIVHRGDFHSLLRLAQAIGELGLALPIKVAVVSSGVHDVTGDERLQPGNATVLGPCGVLPKEYPNVECFNIDLPENPSEEMRAALLCEFSRDHTNPVIAYRGRYRWERRYRQVELPQGQAKSLEAWRGVPHHRRDRRHRPRARQALRHHLPGDTRTHQEDAVVRAHEARLAGDRAGGCADRGRGGGRLRRGANAGSRRRHFEKARQARWRDPRGRHRARGADAGKNAGGGRQRARAQGARHARPVRGAEEGEPRLPGAFLVDECGHHAVFGVRLQRG